MLYRIKYLKVAVEQLSKIPRNIRNSILKAIDERLSVCPTKFKPLKGELIGYYRLRIGKYRVIYKVNNETITVLIIRVDVQGNVYR
ncbi:MAG: type II toxin-antitoxin system RelE/ParE family toxin [Alphaproteobacteria bacterium]|nr:type II toxin-antitoxin system RelE/ParE family toxin [Alphaproteobacteria bacterium]MBQ3944892.1 type II toxin-antitoxin system RelE/ParE family toxin [Alphaproteobacteria bacterium]